MFVFTPRTCRQRVHRDGKGVGSAGVEDRGSFDNSGEEEGGEHEGVVGEGAGGVGEVVNWETSHS